MKMLKMLTLTAVCVLAAVSAGSGSGHIGWEDVRVMTEDLAPLGYIDVRDGKLKGASVERVDAALRRLDPRLGIEVLPWARALVTADSEQKVFIFNLARTPEREHRYKWVCPMAEKKLGVFALRKRTDIRISKIDDIRRYGTVVVNRNIAHVLLLSRGFGKGKSEGFYPVAGEATAVRMLYNGRADIWVRTYLNSHDIDAHVRDAGYDPSSMVLVSEIAEMKVSLYLAASLSTPDEMVAAMRRAMGE